MNAVLSLSSVLLVIITALLSSSEYLHWFILPLAACGVLTALDAYEWITGRLDILDSVGLMGVYGFHFFLLAPLLHVGWGYWMTGVTYPPDWRDWLGWMGAVNLLGLIAYRTARELGFRSSSRIEYWKIDSKRFWPLLITALVITAVVQGMVYLRYGGLLGYVTAYTERTGAFEGMGVVFMVSESFPILALMGVAVWAKRTGRAIRPATVLGLVVVFVVLRMLFGGLRGSRANTIWAVFWAVGIIHSWIRPIPKKAMLPAVGALLLFAYGYGLYKAAGLEGVTALSDPDLRAQMSVETGRTVETVLLADLGRSDVQAYLLYRVASPDSDYEYAVGKTYVGSASLLVPRSWWPTRPPTKVAAGTEAQYGAGTFDSGGWKSSRIYGLAGESLLNFGWVSIPIAYGVYGYALGALRRWRIHLRADDGRSLIYPFLVALSFIALASDSDNLMFTLIKNVAVPFLVVFLSRVVVSRTGEA